MERVGEHYSYRDVYPSKASVQQTTVARTITNNINTIVELSYRMLIGHKAIDRQYTGHTVSVNSEKRN